MFEYEKCDKQDVIKDNISIENISGGVYHKELSCLDVLYIVMPAYNEEENIRRVVSEWYPLLKGKDEKSRLVVADSESSDSTHNILLELKKEYVQMEILSNTGRTHGAKVIALYDYAIRNGADYIFQTDSDGQTNPDEFGAFWQERNDYDVVMGFRSKREDGQQRAFVEKIVCLLLKVYFGVSVPDANAPFRLMKSSIVEKYLYKLAPEYNLPNIMMTTYFAYYGEKMSFREITFKPRQGGINSINIKKIVKIGWNALRDFYAFRKDMIKK